MRIQWCIKVNAKVIFIFQYYIHIILSTMSSGLNSLAAVVLSDIIKFFYQKDMTDKQDLLVSKMLCKLDKKLYSFDINHMHFL